MSDQSTKATITELYNVIGQLIKAYDDVMDTFGSVIGDVVTMQSDIGEIEKFVNEQFINAIQARDLWKSIATVHRDKAEEMRVQLKLLADQGKRIEVEIPVRAKK